MSESKVVKQPRITKGAEIDILGLTEFFIDIDPDLGIRFVEELVVTLDLVKHYPEHYGFYDKDIVRRCAFPELKCLLLYVIRPAATIGLVVAHAHESPKSISMRLKKRLIEFP